MRQSVEGPSLMEHVSREESERREREFEDQIATRYNRDYHEPPIMEGHSRAFVGFAARFVNPGDRVLDLGCASASLWPLFRELLPSDVELAGVDLSPGMLQEARRRFPDGKFREGSMSAVPFGNGEFDVVIVSSAFHHISDDQLPSALAEVHRVLDEHGILIGREPLGQGRLSDRGGWVAGALMHLRHLAYRLTRTREFPEPDAGPDHHAYEARAFLKAINSTLTTVAVEFRNPASLFFARSHHPIVVDVARHLDELIEHREGQEIHYAARKNYSTAKDVVDCVEKALAENRVADLNQFLVHVAAAARIIEREISSPERAHGK